MESASRRMGVSLNCRPGAPRSAHAAAHAGPERLDALVEELRLRVLALQRLVDVQRLAHDALFLEDFRDKEAALRREGVFRKILLDLVEGDHRERLLPPP